MKPACASCVYFDRGHCRVSHHEWPATDADDWCGEWHDGERGFLEHIRQPKPEPEPAAEWPEWVRRPPSLMDLVKLAAQRVPGFETPMAYCHMCTEPTEFPGRVRDEYGQSRTCGECAGTGTLPSESPAAIVMAVLLCAQKRAHWEVRIASTSTTVMGPRFCAWRAPECTEEGAESAIAWTLLRAFLDAHSVEVPREP